jgi:nucleoside-diphosphate-sugar epimerase
MPVLIPGRTEFLGRAVTEAALGRGSTVTLICLLAGRRATPGDVVHEVRAWVVNHAVGPLNPAPWLPARVST